MPKGKAATLTYRIGISEVVDLVVNEETDKVK